MNVGICIIHQPEGMEEKFRDAAAMGFAHCQLVSWVPSLWTEAEAARMDALRRQYGIEITAFWCGWEGPRVWNFTEGPLTLGLVPPVFRYARMRNLMDGADFARRLGVGDIVSHMGFIPEVPSDPEYAGVVVALRTVAAHLKANGQSLLFETGQETPVTLLRLFEDVGTGNLFVNLDPANLIMYGKANPVDALDVFGAYIRGVHAKDGRYPTDGRKLGPEVKVGTGKVDFYALLAALKALGYDGSLTIEREISGEQQIRDIRDTKEYLERIIAGLLVRRGGLDSHELM